MPRRLSLGNNPRLVLRQHISAYFINAKADGDGAGGAFVIARGHDDPQAKAKQRLQRGGGGFLYRISDRHHARDGPVQDHEHHGFALVAALIRPHHQIGRVQAHTATLMTSDLPGGHLPYLSVTQADPLRLMALSADGALLVSDNGGALWRAAVE